MIRLIRRDWRELILVALCLGLWVVTSATADALWGSEVPQAAAQPSVIVDKLPAETVGKDPDESSKIEAALIEQGYLRDDIPLSYDLQDYLHTAAEEAGIPYELALAVIKQETEFRNVTGDDGCSVGYMQIQERWHADRMDKLGVEDLMDPAGNFRVGCSFLAELLSKYNLEDALTCYNSGKPGKSEYANNVINYMEGATTP